MSGPRALQILEICDDKFKVNSPNFASVLSKVGDRPFVLYSINGPTNTGKSFALNFLLRFWEAKTHHVHNWFEHDPKGTKFVWQQSEKELERTTIGIYLWSEPYFVTQKIEDDEEQGEEEEVAILLMDTQGLFDEKTTDHENAIVFSLSTLCSSVSIFNLAKNIDESVLERLQFFSGYAHLASDEGSKLNQIEAFQKLIFLVRDFESDDYEAGYHDMYWTVPTSPHNICLDTFVKTSEMSPLKKFVREQILECYKNVAVYLIPSPGQRFLKNNQEQIEPKFNVHIKKFIEILTSAGNLPIKQVGGKRVTGTQFQKYFERWAQICTQANSHFPQGQTREESNTIVQNTLAFGTFASEYEKKIQNYIETHPEGITDSELFSVHKIWQKEGLDNFFAMNTCGDEELRAKYGDLLLDHTTEFFESVRKVNHGIEQKSQEEENKVKIKEDKEKLKQMEKDDKNKGNDRKISNIKEFIHKGLGQIFAKIF